MNLSKSNAVGVLLILGIIATLVFAGPKLASGAEEKEKEKEKVVVVTSVAAGSVVVEETEVPDAPAPVTVERRWYEGGQEFLVNWYNSDDIAEARIVELEAALVVAAGVQLHHDTLVENLQDQNKRDAEFFESLLAESEREVAGLRLHNKALDESMTALLDKDNSLMYVEGCYVARP